MIRKWRKAFIFIGAILLISGCGNENKVNKTIDEEDDDARQEEYSLDTFQSIFEMDWVTFKSYWNQVGDKDLNVINETEKTSFLTIRHDGEINDTLWVSANTDENTDKVRYSAVLGTVDEDDSDVYKASEKLILLADSTLSIASKEKIIEYLGLANREIEREKIELYSENGIIYKAEFEYYDGKLPFLTVSVEKE